MNPTCKQCGNLRDSDCEFCVTDAKAFGDDEGAELASILLQMSPTQRRKMVKHV